MSVVDAHHKRLVVFIITHSVVATKITELLSQVNDLHIPSSLTSYSTRLYKYLSQYCFMGSNKKRIFHQAASYAQRLGNADFITVYLNRPFYDTNVFPIGVNLHRYLDRASATSVHATESPASTPKPPSPEADVICFPKGVSGPRRTNIPAYLRAASRRIRVFTRARFGGLVGHT